MEQNEKIPNAGQKFSKHSIFDQPRKAVSGMVYSGTVLGMLLISFVFSVTLALFAQITQQPMEELSRTELYRYLTYLLYYVVYIVVILVFCRVYREKPCSFGYRNCKVRYWLLAFPLAFGLLFGLNFVNAYFVEFLSLFGYTAPEAQIPSVAGGGFWGVLITVAFLPAIFEETILRGIVLEGIKDLGTIAACLLGGLLFSLFHMNPAQTVYQFLCGCVFTLLVLRANSIYPAVIVHFLNNAVIVADYKWNFLARLSTEANWIVLICAGISLVGSIVFLIFSERSGREKKKGAIRPFLLPALIGILLCGILWIANFAAGRIGS